MFSALKGGALYVAGGVVAALLACTTVLAWHGTLTGSDALAVFTGVSTAVTGVAAAHVAGQAATNAAQAGANAVLAPPGGQPPTAMAGALRQAPGPVSVAAGGEHAT